MPCQQLVARRYGKPEAAMKPMTGGACSQVHAPQVANSSRRAARNQLKLWVAG